MGYPCAIQHGRGGQPSGKDADDEDGVHHASLHGRAWRCILGEGGAASFVTTAAIVTRAAPSSPLPVPNCAAHARA